MGNNTISIVSSQLNLKSWIKIFSFIIIGLYWSKIATGQIHDSSYFLVAQQTSLDPFEHLDLNGQPNEIELKMLRIILLNKITAKTQEFSISLNQKLIFEDLEIIVLQCTSNKDPYSTDKYLLVRITEKKVAADDNLIFEGWLVTNNPAVSSIEHPLYEIFAVNLPQF